MPALWAASAAAEEESSAEDSAALLLPLLLLFHRRPAAIHAPRQPLDVALVDCNLEKTNRVVVIILSI